jgi:hypothetical protein
LAAKTAASTLRNVSRAHRLDWRIDRVHAALMRPMPIGCDAEGAYFITLPGRRRLRPFRRGGGDDDDAGDEPDDDA